MFEQLSGSSVIFLNAHIMVHDKNQRGQGIKDSPQEITFIHKPFILSGERESYKMV
jgi:hypothetical protein